MTYRYRCPFCGSHSSQNASKARSHMFIRHRTALVQGLSIIEGYDTPEGENPP